MLELQLRIPLSPSLSLYIILFFSIVSYACASIYVVSYYFLIDFAIVITIFAGCGYSYTVIVLFILFYRIRYFLLTI